MDATRREFVLSSLLAAGLPLTGALLAADAAEAAGATGTHPGKAVDHDLLKFWMQDVRNPQYAARARSRGRGRGGGTDPAADDANFLPVFYVWTQDKGIRPAAEVANDELLDKGDVSVSYKLNTFKASQRDQQHRVQAGSLRFDVRQANTLPNFSEPLSWATISALALNNDRIPPLIKDILDPHDYWGQIPTVVLPGGTGYWAYNLFVQERPHQNFFNQLFSFLRNGVETVGLIASLGIPAISHTALHAVDSMYAAMSAIDVAKTHNLYKTADTPIAATKDGMQKAQSQFQLTDELPLPLLPAKYIAVPASSHEPFKAALPKLNLKKGYLIGSDVTADEGPDLAAAAIHNADLQDVTYLTFSVAVAPT